MSGQPVPVGVVVEEVVEQISRDTFGEPLDLVACSDAERRAYWWGHHVGHGEGWRAGERFARTSAELTAYAAAEFARNVEAFRADHERRQQQHVGGGGA